MAEMKKKRSINPILKKELQLGSRSIRMPIFVMIYDIVLSVIAIAIIAVIGLVNSNGQTDFSNYLTIYQIIGWTQLAITLIIVPILTAGTISGERERQTLDIMLTTPKSPISIVFGKLSASLANYMIYVISSIPIMSIAFILGGLNWFALLGYILMMFVVAAYVGSIGVYCSSTFKTTIAAVVVTFLIAAAMLILPFILFFLLYGGGDVVYKQITHTSSSTFTVGTIPDFNMGPLPMIMLLNPLSGFFDYMMMTMDITSIHQLIQESGDFGTIMPILSYAWIPMNIIVCGLISYLFIRKAAKQLNPLKKRRRKKPKFTAPPMVQSTPQQIPVPQAPQLYQPNPQQTIEPNSQQTAEPITERLRANTNVR